MNKLVAALLVLSLAGAAPAKAQYVDVNTLIGSIGGAAFHDAAYRVDSASSAQVVRISSFAGADAAAGRLAERESASSEALDFLHGNLRLNPMAMSAVRGAGVSVDQVVAIFMPSDGAAILYVDDLNF